MIETAELTKRFGSVHAVHRVSWSVQGSGIVGFLGPNGAGKTTMMRLLTGFLPATSGRATVAGFDVFEQPLEVKARVGYLPERPPLYPELKVGEYLNFVAEIRGVPKSRRLRQVGAALERLGLSGWERRRLGTLSKGYRQRVGLAQALVHDPPLVLLDEPTSGLDPGQRVAVRALIGELSRERTVVLSTHVLSEVEALCDTVALMHHGALVGQGTVEELAVAAGVGPWLELQVDPPHDLDLAPELARLPVVQRVERLGPGDYRIEGGRDADPQVAALAAREGWALRSLQRHPASLERVFLGLVEGDP